MLIKTYINDEERLHIYREWWWSSRRINLTLLDVFLLGKDWLFELDIW